MRGSCFSLFLLVVLGRAPTKPAFVLPLGQMGRGKRQRGMEQERMAFVGGGHLRLARGGGRDCDGGNGNGEVLVVARGEGGFNLCLSVGGGL